MRDITQRELAALLLPIPLYRLQRTLKHLIAIPMLQTVLLLTQILQDIVV